MTADTIKVEGLNTLTATLEKFARDVQSMPDATGPNATTVLNESKRRVPIRSGRLASSGFASSTGTESVVGFSADHAGPIQFGVGPRVGLRGPHNIRATDFLFSAADSKVPDVVDRIAEAVADRLSRVKGA